MDKAASQTNYYISISGAGSQALEYLVKVQSVVTLQCVKNHPKGSLMRMLPGPISKNF